MSSHSGDSDDVGTLGESAYEILTDSAILYTDDEDMASSVASIDDITDDNISLADTESLSAYGGDEDTLQDDRDDDNPIPSFTGLDEQHLHHPSDVDMSRLHHRLSDSAILDDHDSEIYFDEPNEGSESELVAVSAKLRGFTETELLEIRSKLPPEYVDTEVYPTVRQTMTKDMLVMDEPLRVLYVGSAVVAEDITKKIGAALAAGSSSESVTGSWDTVKSPKFSVVSVSSFGARSTSPEVELIDSSGLEIVVDTCTSAQGSKNPEKNFNDTISLWLNNNRNVVSQPDSNGKIQLECSGWKLPHLAIVFCSEHDSSQARSTRIVARQFLSRHNIPTMVISQEPLFGKKSDSIHVNPRSLYVCIESPSSDGDDLIHKRMPVDLETFLNVNPRQLNRNLSCITGLGLEDDALKRGKSLNDSSVFEKDDRKMDRFSSFVTMLPESFTEKTVKNILMWALACLFAGAAIGGTYVFKTPSPIPQPIIQHISTSAISTYAPSSYSSQLSIIPNTATTTSTKIAVAVVTSSTITSLSTISPIPSRQPEPEKQQVPTINESDKFQIRRIGPNNIIVHPPQSYLLLKKAPRLHVTVTRNGKDVPAELSTLFEGAHSAYTLTIPEDQAFGLMNVRISTKTKPIIHEELSVDFGAHWLPTERLMRAINKGNQKAIEVIGNVLESATEFSHELQKVVEKQVEEAKVYSDLAIEDIMVLRDQISKKLWKQVELGKGLYSEQKDKSGQAVKKARMQAKKFWRKAEQERLQIQHRRRR